MKRIRFGMLLCSICFSSPAFAMSTQTQTLPVEMEQTVKTLLNNCNVTGSVTIYDADKDRWWFSDRADAEKTTLPGSSFKIINSLIALESGAVADENEIIAWDGKEKRNPWTNKYMVEWNQDTNLRSAMKNSTMWFHEKVAERRTLDDYARYLKLANYGNGDYSARKGVNFWVYGNFGVSPIQQINFLRGLHASSLPFSKRAMEITKDIIIEEQTPDYILRGKTGWPQTGGKNIGWWVGYVEMPNKNYFFATRLYSEITPEENPPFLSCRKTITKAVLRDMGVPLKY